MDLEKNPLRCQFILQAGCSKKIAKSLAAQAMYEQIPAEWKVGAGQGGNKVSLWSTMNT